MGAACRDPVRAHQDPNKMTFSVGLFHPGTQHSWQTARALQELEVLEWYATSLFFASNSTWLRLAAALPEPFRGRLVSEFARFHHPALDSDKVITLGWFELAERICRRLGFPKLARELNFRGNRAFGNQLAARCRKNPPAVLWGYDTSSLQVFLQAGGNDTKCILDKTIGDGRAYNEIMTSLYHEVPEFFGPHVEPLLSQDMIDLQDEEYEASDVILAGSDYCAETIRAHSCKSAHKKIHVLPYCFDALYFSSHQRHVRRRATGPVRFLFVGQAGPRKGIHLLLKAFARLAESSATLTIVGQLQIPPETYARYSDRVKLVPPVARQGIPALMADADVLVFPSFFEGAGIVLYEALARGLGIIQSRHAAIAASPNSGLVLSELTEEALYLAMQRVVDDRRLVELWSAGAYEEAGRFSYDRYRKNIGLLLANVASYGRHDMKDRHHTICPGVTKVAT
jgi:glycosyltransferase involved in cell wall biosynthesis